MTRCIKRGVKRKVQQEMKKLIVTKYDQNVCHWHEHKHASVMAVDQLPSMTASSSHAIHAADAVAAHQCQELWSHTHVAE